MSDTVIHVENLGKKYIIGHQKPERYTALRDVIAHGVKSLGRKFLPPWGKETAEPEFDEFWALKDVSFEIKQGDRIGIIGRNGAGKSTLLKILSRITEPSCGRISIKGRVASLLEVGTGFHPELTGRENIYLNGAILGMSKVEIKRQFDEIVAFAEVEKFLDTPVKRYSSGMYVRLAFAVAAHLEPEILIVDEVLAVGDAQFQKKCLGKMEDVSKGGRTVLFVSHQMSAVTRLCEKCLLLDQGNLKLDGDVYVVTNKYLQSDLGTSAERSWSDPKTAPGNDIVRLKAVRIVSNGSITDTVDISHAVTIEVEYWNYKSDSELICGLAFLNEQGVILFISNDFNEADWSNKPKLLGKYKSICTLPANLLSEGQVRISVQVRNVNHLDNHILEHDIVAFQVVDSNNLGALQYNWSGHIPGLIRPKLSWKVLLLEDYNNN